MTADTLSLHEKLMDIQQRLKVPKDQYNSFGSFNYRNLETIEEQLKPLLKEHSLILTFDDEVIAVGDRVFLKATAKLSNGTEVITASAYAQHAVSKTKMDDAQLTGSCSSYARKYAAGGMFLIDETKDADSMDNTKPTTAPRSVLKRPATTGWKPSASNPVSDQQRDTISNLLRQRGIETRDAITEWMYDNYGGVPNNEADAQQIIDDLDHARKVANGQIKEPAV